MMKSILAIALATAALGASAHPRAYTHYHGDNGVVMGNQIAPRASTTYSTDQYGRQVRVVTTVRCTEMMRNPRNNHLRCTEEETTVQQFVEGGYQQHPQYQQGYYDRPGYGEPRPVYVNPGYNNGYGYRQVDPAAAVIGAVINEIQRDDRRDDDRGYYATHSSQWTPCASEGGVCNVSGPAQVRFGANGNYAYKTTSSSIACTNSVFGDPAPNVVKSCSYNRNVR